MRRPDPESGAAMVETAILLIVLVPLFLFGITLSDMAYHQLEVQEAVVSTIWDFSQRNVEPSGSGSHSGNTDADIAAVGGYNRMLFSDHTSAYDDPKDLKGKGETHHTQIGVHACFFGGAEGSDYDDTSVSTQIACTVDASKDSDWMLVSGKQFAQSELTHGGVATCWAKAWLYNYLIPEKFMQNQSHVALTTKTHHNGGSTGYEGVHKINGAGGMAENMMVRDRVALSYDTWGIMNGAPSSSGWNLDNADIGADTRDLIDGNNPLYKRVSFNYRKDGAQQATYAAALAAAGAYAASALSKQLEIVIINPINPTPTQFPNPIAYNLAAPYVVARYQKNQPYSNATRYNSLESSPYTSYANDNYVKAYNARGPYYMGNKSPLK